VYFVYFVVRVVAAFERESDTNSDVKLGPERAVCAAADVRRLPVFQSLAATAAAASAEVTTGMTSNSVMSFQFAIH
jgi:hypothetical protein